MVTEDYREITIPCVHTRQPAGDFFVGVIPSKLLCEIADFDVRRVIRDERDIEKYLGIQRPLNRSRVSELKEYVNFIDACFPTSIVIAVPSECASYNGDSRTMTLSNFSGESEDEAIWFRNIARVIDGQHRIAGLMGYAGDEFDVSVTILVGFDIAEQAHIFSTVNLSQTKVSKSLAYDLFDLARTRSPQKTCHNVAVALDQKKEGPLYRRIKRLGKAGVGRLGETLTQATFVEGLMQHMTRDPRGDRDILLRDKILEPADADTLRKFPLRNMFIEDRDLDIAVLIGNYFDAIRSRWPEAWNYGGKGLVLNRTNGFRALMRLFKHVYLHLGYPGEVVAMDQFSSLFSKSTMNDEDFKVEIFKPGTSGESLLYHTFLAELNLDD